MIVIPGLNLSDIAMLAYQNAAAAIASDPHLDVEVALARSNKLVVLAFHEPSVRVGFAKAAEETAVPDYLSGLSNSPSGATAALSAPQAGT